MAGKTVSGNCRPTRGRSLSVTSLIATIISSTQPPPSTEGAVIRRPSSQSQLLVTPFSKHPDLTTVHSLLFHSASKFANNPCVASRKVAAYTTDGRGGAPTVGGVPGGGVDAPWTDYGDEKAKERVKLGDWEYTKYRDVEQKVRVLAAALAAITKPGGGGGGEARLHMFARNRFGSSAPDVCILILNPRSPDWFAMSHAASLASIPLVTVYSRAGPSVLTGSITATRAAAIFVDSDRLSSLLGPLVECPCVRVIIYTPVSTADVDLKRAATDIEALRAGLGDGMTIITVEELAQMGQVYLEAQDHNHDREPNTNEAAAEGMRGGAKAGAARDAVWAIMYPLGDPKMPLRGVVIKTSNLVATIASVYKLLKPSVVKADTYLSYLPLSFMLEFALVNAFLLLGTTVGFGTSSISYLLPHPFSALHPSCPGDIESFGPSILFGVPPWWDTVHGHALKELSLRPPKFQERFWTAMLRKKFLVEGGLEMVTSLAVAAVERKGGIREIREMLFGKRMRWTGISCSASAVEKREFMGLLFGSSGKMVQCWSLMEMSAVVSFMSPDQWSLRALGLPIPSVEIKLVDYPSLSYTTLTVPPRGQIFIRGPSVPDMGYFNDPDASTGTFPDGGWINTGQIGEWNSLSGRAGNRGLTIIDTVKPFEGRPYGDYYAVQKLQTVYETCELVEECCLIYTGRKVKPVAIISVSKENLFDFSRKHALRFSELDTLLLLVSLKKLVVGELNRIGRAAGLVEFELVGGVVMVKESLPRDVCGKIHREAARRRHCAELEHELI